MQELIKVNSEEEISSRIFEIRGKQVILDKDLAEYFQVETRILNQVVKRNVERFPEEFCFQLTQKEFQTISRKRLLNEISSDIGNKTGKHTKYLPYVFTEHGVVMIASLLKSDIAVKESIKIVKAFVAMKKVINQALSLQENINGLVFKHDNEISNINNELQVIENSLQRIETKEFVNMLYYNGQLFDAYSKLIDILNEAKKEIIIIDTYADKSVLDIVSSINKNVILVTSNRKLKDIDIEKYNEQYNNLKVIFTNNFHDRYIILDKNKVYNLGISINHFGNKVAGINLIEEQEVKNVIIKLVENLM